MLQVGSTYIQEAWRVVSIQASLRSHKNTFQCAQLCVVECEMENMPWKPSVETCKFKLKNFEKVRDVKWTPANASLSTTPSNALEHYSRFPHTRSTNASTFTLSTAKNSTLSPFTSTRSRRSIFTASATATATTSGDLEPTTDETTPDETAGSLPATDVGSELGIVATDESSHRRDSLVLTSAGLVMGTAVGPGILGLPAATIASGLLPSSLIILASWTYVMASILLVVELSCSVLSKEATGEPGSHGSHAVSFAGLAEATLGSSSALLVATVYAALNYSLLVACIAGLGEIVSAISGGFLPPALASLLASLLVSLTVLCCPFAAVDLLNRALCGLMLTSTGLLLAMGLPHIAPASLLATASWSPAALLPAVPITVLTLGFHVITPLICSLLEGNLERARKAVLIGGAIPLAMVLAWNTVVLGIAPPSASASAVNPIALLLSLGTSAAPCVQAFALSALGTTLIGYALSFPAQLSDTLHMWTKGKQALEEGGLVAESFAGSDVSASGVGFTEGRTATKGRNESSIDGWKENRRLSIFAAAILPPLLLAVFCPSVFSSALDFAGIYANCFLFGMLPPAMTWVMRYGHPFKQSGRVYRGREALPGGKPVLVALFGIALFLGLRPPSF